MLWFLLSKQLCEQPLSHSWKSSSSPELPLCPSSASQQDSRALISLLHAYRQENEIKLQHQQAAVIPAFSIKPAIESSSHSSLRFTHCMFIKPGFDSVNLSLIMEIMVESGFWMNESFCHKWTRFNESEFEAWITDFQKLPVCHDYDSFLKHLLSQRLDHWIFQWQITFSESVFKSVFKSLNHFIMT